MDSSEATSAPTPSSAATSPDISTNPNEPNGILNELNGVLDANEGRELFDQAEVKVAVMKAMERMKDDYEVVVTQAELNEA
ncbi:hypothetical protein FRC06_010937, partial [Ceratobasidium sp. 370]